MRRVLLGVAAPVLVLAGAGGYIGMVVTDVTPIVDGATLPGGAVAVQDGYVAVYALPVGDNHVVLIDCGNDTEAKAIKERNWIVDAVLLTHGHVDHINGCRAMRDVPIYALEEERAYVFGDEAPRGPLVKLLPAHKAHLEVKRGLRDGEEIVFGDKTIRVYAVPGHTPGSAAYLVDGVLYVGDVATFDGDGKVRGAPWFFSDDEEQNKASVKKLAERAKDVRMLAPAHSAPKEAGAELLATIR